VTPRILKRPQIERDLIDHFAAIARDKIEPAERFLRVAEESFSQLAANPFVGQKWDSQLPQLADVRVSAMPSRFSNYLIFYRPIANGVEILTVIHGARDLQRALERIFGRTS
jgi:toxin ParE1/3/4